MVCVGIDVAKDKHDWRKPTFAALAVIKTCLAVAEPVSASTAHSTTIIVAFFLILQCIILSRHIFVRLAFYADADVVVADIFTDFDGLSIRIALIQQLDGERMMLNNFCFSVFQKMAHLAKTDSRHQTFAILTENTSASAHARYSFRIIVVNR